MTDTTALKIKILKEMNDYVLEDIGNDDFTELWLMDGVPDACDNEMYQFIAKNDECWVRTVATFAKICGRTNITENFDEDIEEIPFE